MNKNIRFLTLITLFNSITSTTCMQSKKTLHEAAKQGELEEIRSLLIGKGTGVDLQNEDGQTALMLAVQAGQLATVDALVHIYNARLDVQDAKQRTALHFAAQKGNGTLKHRKYIARLLLKRGANANARNAIGYTPLHTAIMCYQDEIAILLLAFGADREIEDITGITPYQYAKARKSTDLVHCLSFSASTALTRLHEINAALDHEHSAESPTNRRLRQVRRKLHAHKIVNAQEEEAQEDTTSHEL